MLLSDIKIRELIGTGDIVIEPFEDSQLQPASYDVRLGSDFLVFKQSPWWQRLASIFYPWMFALDPKESSADQMQKVTVAEGMPFILMPRQFALGVTHEIIGVSSAYSCELGGKSSLARLGLIVHATAGFIDPGNSLRITFEFYNLCPHPIMLWPMMKCGQVFFMPLDQRCERPYGSAGLGSKYFRDAGVEASKMHENFEVLS